MLEHLKQLIIEAHRRSLWQVLGVYLVSSWAVLQVVGELTRSAGLPDWVPGFALVLLLIGLPIVMATAVVQEGGPVHERRRRRARQHRKAPATVAAGEAAAQDTSAAEAPAAQTPPPAAVRQPEPPQRPSFLQRNLTWRRSLLGGVAAFGFLALLTGAYLVSWATGIGPVGSLLARGAIEHGDRIVLADFGSAADPALGAVVTEALRIDLLESRILRLVEPTEVREILARMQVRDEVSLTAPLAREVALREGVKAVLEGEVARAGSGYVLTAILRAAESGESLAAFRETARGDEDLIPAIDRLSRRIRERAGESLRSIHATPPLERVTTSSLDALRLYSQAIRAANRNDYRRAVLLLEETLEQDPEFAAAWNLLAVTLYNARLDPARERYAATRAYQLRERLSARERHQIAAEYYGTVRGDRNAAMDAYRRMLELDRDDPTALNNLGNYYRWAEEYEAAAELYQRAIAAHPENTVTFGNLIATRLHTGQLAAARETLEAFAAQHPDHPSVTLWRFWVALRHDDPEAGRAQLQSPLESPGLDPWARSQVHDAMARVALWTGRLGEARQHFEAAERSAGEAGAGFAWGARLWRAHAEVAAGDPQRGIRLLEQWPLDAVPPENRRHYLHALVWGLAERPAEAEAVIRSWEAEVAPELRGRTERIEMDAARALVLLHRGDPAGAVRLLEEVRASYPCRDCFAEKMGWALREAGALREAAAEWEKVLDWKIGARAVGFLRAHYLYLWTLPRLAALYEELGERERALVHYRRLAELWSDADPELQPVVRHARERIAALERGG